MSILDNESCIGAFGRDYEPPFCERCHKNEPVDGDDYCQACADHVWMRELLSGLTDEERADIILAGAL